MELSGTNRISGYDPGSDITCENNDTAHIVHILYWPWLPHRLLLMSWQNMWCHPNIHLNVRKIPVLLGYSKEGYAILSVNKSDIHNKKPSELSSPTLDSTTLATTLAPFHPKVSVSSADQVMDSAWTSYSTWNGLLSQSDPPSHNPENLHSLVVYDALRSGSQMRLL
jgi:hypothetical protein